MAVEVRQPQAPGLRREPPLWIGERADGQDVPLGRDRLANPELQFWQHSTRAFG